MYKKRSLSRKIIRLRNFDYSKPGYYFVTICTKDMVDYFGRVNQGKMTLNKFGKIAKDNWTDISNHFPNVSIDEFIVMPDHVHGIIITQPVGEIHLMSRGMINHAPTRDHVEDVKLTVKNNPMQMGNVTLGKIIRFYKGRTSYMINKLNNNIHFQWQRQYYDHVIRNEKSLNQIRWYIKSNPLEYKKFKL